MPSVLRPFRLMRTLLVILVAAMLGTATEQSVEVVPSSRGSFSVDNFTCADVVRSLPPTVESPLIMQVVNEAYLVMEENFLLFMKQNAPQRLDSMYVICVDEMSAAMMKAKFGLPCVRLDGVENRRDLLVTRVNTLVCLLQGGYDVVASDNDALWLGDPIPDLLKIEGDILFQRGRYPKQYGDPIHGLTLCTGFALYRAGGEGMGHFLEVMVESFEKTKEGDQLAHTMAASLLGLKWDYNETTSDMRTYGSTRAGRGVLTALPGNFAVVLLPDNKYTRNCIETPVSSETLIAHCFPRGNRVRAMKKANMWLAD